MEAETCFNYCNERQLIYQADMKIILMIPIYKRFWLLYTLI